MITILSVVSSVAQVLSACFTLLVISQGSLIGDFLNWCFNLVRLGGFLDFLLSHVPVVGSVLAVLVLLKWCRDWRILAGVGVAFALFLSYVM